jgi:Ca2+-binding RTX toxin-like protein
VDIGNITGTWNDAGILTLSGTDTVANYQAALRSVLFVSTSQSAATRTLRFTVDDGQATNHQSAVASRLVSGNLQMVGTTLSVYGTAQPDTISVTTTGTLAVNFNGVTHSFVSSAVTAINIYGYAGNDVVNINSLATGTSLTADGGDNNDTITVSSSVTQGVSLIGGAGNDALTGGAGNDRYIFNTNVVLGSDTINDTAGGSDTLDFSATTSRSITVDLSKTTAQVVNSALILTLSSTTTLENVVGGALSDAITGNSLSNVLTGGAGDDTYIFDTDLTLGSDTINEAAGGIDTLDFGGTSTRSIAIDLSRATSQVINAGLTLTLQSGSTVENVIGGTLSDAFTGNSLDNVFTGGAGDDNYVFDTDLTLGGDTINEAAGGTDTLDFSGTTTRRIAIDLSQSTLQVVNRGLTLTLNSATTMENVIGGSLGDTFTGNSLANVMTGGAGDDVYLFDTDLSLGSDTINEAGVGTDLLDFSATSNRSVIIDLSTTAVQVVNAGLRLTLASGSTMESVIGGALSDTFTGNVLNNRFTGGAGNDTYLFDTDLALGSDIIQEDGGGTDKIDFSATTGRSITIDLSNAASQVINAGLTLTLSSATTIENVTGGSLNDTITGNSLDNALAGGAGNDTFLFDTDLSLGTDTINEAGGGTDTLDFSSSTTRSITIDLSNAAVQTINAGLSLVLSSSGTIENVIGTALNDTFTGNSLANGFTGGAGNDTYKFDTDIALGSDIINESGSGTDTIDLSATTTRNIAIDLSLGVAQLVNAGLTLKLSSGTTIENVIAGALNDAITGNSLDNVLTGGPGNDTYAFDTDLALGNDLVNEVGTGTDTINFNGTTTRNIVFDLSVATSQVVNAGLTLTLSSGNAFENVIGGTLDDTFTGNSQNNVLTGGAGNDTYNFDSDASLGSDTVNESGIGTDTLDFGETSSRNINIDLSKTTAQLVNAGLTLTLSSGASIENVIGTLLNDILVGNSLSNVLTGGPGNDTYVFDTDLAHGSDTIDEAGGGTDTLDFSASTTRNIVIDLSNASAQAVNTALTLTLSSATAVENVNGGSLRDTLTGNSANNVLSGGAGNDTFMFNTNTALGSDLVNDSEGIDAVSFVGSTAGVNVNLGLATTQTVNVNLILRLSSVTAIENLIGGSGDDTLTGNSLDNTLLGDAGNDMLSGVSGNDVYKFNTNSALGSDTVLDSAGIDTLSFVGSTAGLSVNLGLATVQTVNTNLILTLGSVTAIENVTGGSGNDVLIGNSLGNILQGGDGNDVLTGSSGNDTLQGGAGKSILIGGLGNDTLLGGASEDLLIGGRYLLETDASVLGTLLAEWTSAAAFNDRKARLAGTLSGGANGSNWLKLGTVKEDNVNDTMTGGAGTDWYLLNVQGTATANRDTVATDLDSVFTEISSWL